MKICKACLKSKRESEFYRNSSGGRFTKCIVCVRSETALDRRNNKLKFQLKDMRYRFRTRYGVSVPNPEQVYTDLMKKQNGKCAICGKPDPKKMLGIDHNHSNGQIRGLLCHSCNLLIGHAKETPEILDKAIAYLKKYSPRPRTKKIFVGDDDHDPNHAWEIEVPV